MKLGDVIFQNLPCLWLVKLINQVQQGGPHHCGIVTGFWCGIPLVTEAFFFGVWTIPLQLFILRWPFGIRVRSWKNRTLIPKLLDFVKGEIGKPYDIYYSESDSAIYCSELVAKGYVASTWTELACTSTVAQVEMADEPAKGLYFHYLGKYPEPSSKIWLVSDLLHAPEFV